MNKPAEQSVIKELAYDVVGIAIVAAFFYVSAKTHTRIPDGNKLSFGDHARLARTLLFG